MNCPACKTGVLETQQGETDEQYVERGFHTIGHEMLVQRVPVSFRACNSCEFCERVVNLSAKDLKMTNSSEEEDHESVCEVCNREGEGGGGGEGRENPDQEIRRGHEVVVGENPALRGGGRLHGRLLWVAACVGAIGAGG